ncbi:MAG: hypothetical protein QW291_00290 [Thermofilaceae archaeon]
MLIVLAVVLKLAYCLPESCSWEEVSELRGKTVYSLAIINRMIYAGTAVGVYTSTDGLSWRDADLPLPTYALISLGDEGILAGTANGVYLSSDEGRTWVEAGLKGLQVYTLAFSKGVVYAGTSDGVYRLSPSAKSWEPGSLRKAVVSLAVDPTNPRVVYAGTRSFLVELGDVYISKDGGLTWTRAWFSNYTHGSLGQQLAGAVVALPLDYSVTCILVNPCDSSKVYACVNFTIIWALVIPQIGGELEFSLDSGSSWETGPLFPPISSAVFQTDCRSLLVGTSGGVYVVITTNGFSYESLGPGNTSIRAIAVDSDRQRIYVGTTNGLLALRTSTAELSLSHPSWVPIDATTLRLSGTLSSSGKGLPGIKLHVLVNDEEIGFCETDSRGNFDCMIPYIIQGKDVEITIQYLSGCYMPSPVSWVFHLVNATVEFKEPSRVSTKVEGLGWYKHGDTAQVSIPPVLLRDISTVYVFEGWKRNGVLVSTSVTYSLTVTEAVELIAAYKVKPIWEVWIGAAIILTVAITIAAILILIVLEVKSGKNRKYKEEVTRLRGRA